jgi:transcriptional regulator with XRE-family HTH domain
MLLLLPSAYRKLYISLGHEKTLLGGLCPSAEAAKLLGVTQPRISNLVRGRIDLFSIDTLIEMLARAGVHVDIVLSTASREPLSGR